MPSNEELYNKQRDSAAALIESECATEMLKVHHEFAKPFFALSRWLLVVSGTIATVLLANADAAAELFGKGWLLIGLTLLLLSGIAGLFAIHLEGAITARVAGFAGLGTLSDAVLPKLAEYNRRLASYAAHLEVADPQEGVRLPDLEKMSSWFEYPRTWCTRWAYGVVNYTDKGEPYRDMVMLFSRQACASRLQLLLVVAVFGVALADVAQQYVREILPSPVSSPAATVPAPLR